MGNAFTSGWNSVHEAKVAVESGLWNLWIPPDEARIVHFLTTEPVTYYQHVIRNSAGKWESHICTQDDCPYCQQGERRSFVGSFLVLVRPFTANGKDVPTNVRIYTPTMRVLSQLEKFPEEAEVESLSTTDIRISRIGSGTSTTYSFMPRTGKLSEEDLAVIRKALGITELTPENMKQVLLTQLTEELENAKKANSAFQENFEESDDEDIPF